MGFRIYIKDENGNELLDGGAWESNLHKLLDICEITNIRCEKCDHNETIMCMMCNCNNENWYKISFSKYLDILNNMPEVIKDNQNISSSFCSLIKNCKKDCNECFNCKLLLDNHFDSLRLNIR